MIDSKFECPRCGDHKFGTDIPNRVRHCHGQTYELARDMLDRGHLYRVKPCVFVWPEADDWKYQTLVIRRERADDPIVDVARKTAVACMLAPIAQIQSDGDTLHTLLLSSQFRGGILAVQFLDVRTGRVHRTAITDDPKKRPWTWVQTDDGWERVNESPWAFESYCEASLVPIEGWQRPISTERDIRVRVIDGPNLSDLATWFRTTTISAPLLSLNREPPHRRAGQPRGAGRCALVRAPRGLPRLSPERQLRDRGVAARRGDRVRPRGHLQRGHRPLLLVGGGLRDPERAQPAAVGAGDPRRLARPHQRRQVDLTPPPPTGPR